MCNVVTLLSLTVSVVYYDYIQPEEDVVPSYQLIEQKWKKSSETKTVAVAQLSPLQTSQLLTVLHCE